MPAKQETQVRSLGQEDPLEKEMATHSSIITWRIPWTEEPGGLPSDTNESDMTERLTHMCAHAHTHTHTHTVKSTPECQGRRNLRNQFVLLHFLDEACKLRVTCLSNKSSNLS